MKHKVGLYISNIYQFDFGPSYPFQIQLPKKLIALENCFLSHLDAFGSVEASVSGNPTDTSLKHLSFIPLTVCHKKPGHQM